MPKDSVPVVQRTYTQYELLLKDVFGKQQYINVNKPAIAVVSTIKKSTNTDVLFYILAALTLLLAGLKAFFGKYFNNLFRVFFNTSLRQSQLTDQLLQARLPSLLFNIFFVLSGGVYIYFLLNYFGLASGVNKAILLLYSIVFLGVIYLGKYLTLKLTGWITGNSITTNSYAFVIFLINKITGILLVPLTIIIAFAQKGLAQSVVYVSFLCLGFLLVLRFFRSYGLLQSQLKISRFHFFLYLIGAEILPLLLIYKGLVVFLSKNT
ncbi:MAG: DUF4271 domain-containing protein [Chitinophagaceae bacterium]|nr:DUF4271 domain-containing protein [Chitinophagaceae bacterium]